MVWTEIRLKKHITVPLTWLDLTRFTFRGSEVSAGGGVSSCSVYVDCCYSELVPTTWAYISQPDTLLWGLHQKHRIQYKNKTEGTTWWWICEEKKPPKQNKNDLFQERKHRSNQWIDGWMKGQWIYMKTATKTYLSRCRVLQNIFMWECKCRGFKTQLFKKYTIES